MASFGLKYIREYTNRHDELCRLEFWFKDYVGSTKQVLGSRDSFILSKELDDPLEPIQAQPANVELLAEGAINFSIDDFYSEDDEYVLCKFYVSPIGGIQRTVFYSGNTGVQFLRDGNNNLIYITPIPGIIPGQQLFIAGQFYTILSINDDFAGILVLQVAETVVSRTLSSVDITIYDIQTTKLIYTGFVLQDETEDAFISYDHFIKLTLTDNLGLLQDVTFDVACGDLDPFQHFTIAQYFSIILSATGLQLPIQIFANLYETTTNNRTTDPAATFADQIRLNSAMFADDNGVWQSCYEILSAILKAFNCCVCQRGGAWVIYRWAELPALDNAPFIGTQFSYDLSEKTAISLLNKPVVISEIGINVLTGGADNVLSATRPYKYIKDTFDYKQPSELIKNLDLNRVGDLLGTSTIIRDGETITIADYVAQYWAPDLVEQQIADNSFLIRVETDSHDIELTRYLIARTNLGDSIDYIMVSAGVYVNAGDTIDISASMRAPNDPSSSYYNYYVSIYNGVDRYWLNSSDIFQQGAWVKQQAPIRTDFNPAGSDYKDWHSWGVQSLQIPIDGWLNIRLGIQDANGGETHWKDIKLNYYPNINQSTRIIGHTHTYTQTGNIKNKNEQDIIIDDSPRNMIAGTLLTNQLTVFAQGNNNYWYPNPASDYVTKTKYWQRTPGEQKRLGEITTEELKQLYGYLRYKLDCTILYTEAIDNLTTFQLPILHGSNFRMAAISSINYADCVCKCVLVEMWKSGEAKVDASYLFEYLYEKS